MSLYIIGKKVDEKKKRDVKDEGVLREPDSRSSSPLTHIQGMFGMQQGITIGMSLIVQWNVYRYHYLKTYVLFDFGLFGYGNGNWEKYNLIKYIIMNNLHRSYET